MKNTLKLTILLIFISSCGRNSLNRTENGLVTTSRIENLEEVKAFSFPKEVSLENDSSELKFMLNAEKIGNGCELKYEKISLDQKDDEAEIKKIISVDKMFSYTENTKIVEDQMVIERFFKNNEDGLESLTCSLNLSNLYTTSGKDLELETLKSDEQVFF